MVEYCSLISESPALSQHVQLKVAQIWNVEIKLFNKEVVSILLWAAATTPGTHQDTSRVPCRHSASSSSFHVADQCSDECLCVHSTPHSVLQSWRLFETQQLPQRRTSPGPAFGVGFCLQKLLQAQPSHYTVTRLTPSFLCFRHLHLNHKVSILFNHSGIPRTQSPEQSHWRSSARGYLWEQNIMNKLKTDLVTNDRSLNSCLVAQESKRNFSCPGWGISLQTGSKRTYSSITKKLCNLQSCIHISQIFYISAHISIYTYHGANVLKLPDDVKGDCSRQWPVYHQ